MPRFSTLLSPRRLASKWARAPTPERLRGRTAGEDMQTDARGWHQEMFVEDTSTWRPATVKVEVGGVTVTMVASPDELHRRWPDLASVDCGDHFRIDTTVKNKPAVVRAVVADQSRRTLGTHGKMGRGVALATPNPQIPRATAPLPKETPLLSICIVARCDECDADAKADIETVLRERGLGQEFGVLHVGKRFAFVNIARSSGWLVNSPSFGGGEDGCEPVGKSNVRVTISNNAGVFSARLVSTDQLVSGDLLFRLHWGSNPALASLLSPAPVLLSASRVLGASPTADRWWSHGGGVNREIKEEIAARVAAAAAAAPHAAIAVNERKRNAAKARTAAMRAAKAAKQEASAAADEDASDDLAVPQPQAVQRRTRSAQPHAHDSGP